MAAKPAWVEAGLPVEASEVPESDYPYLAERLEEHGRPAADYFVSLFERHQIVILGEMHNVKEHKDFVIELIPRLYHEGGVRCIGWEFSRYTDNPRLAELVVGDELAGEEVLEFARGQSVEWNSKEHWDIIEAVWRLNHSLEPAQERMRLVGLQPNTDVPQYWITVKTKPQDSPEFREVMEAVGLSVDATMATHAETEIIERGEKGLFFVGHGHDYTHYEYPPDIAMGRPIMGNLLYKKYGDRVFQVWPGCGWEPVIEEVMALRQHERIGFDLYASPFANILTPTQFPEGGVPFSKVARGFVYLGPTSELHRNTTIKGFVTEEMFRAHKE